MGFDVDAGSYDRFIGIYSRQLAPQLADLAGATNGRSALDVGCGPGALTAELAARLGPGSVVAVDPSPSFVDAIRARIPGVEVRQASAESLPFPDDAFDVTLAQLVVHFMSDPVAGLGEMARVTRPGGVVAACVWDHAGEQSPLTVFWQAVRALDPGVRDESGLAGARAGHLAELFAAAGLRDVEETALPVAVRHGTFEEWWGPFLAGIGPAGSYLAGLDEDARAAVRESCRERLGPPPFTISARAWTARGRA